MKTVMSLGSLCSVWHLGCSIVHVLIYSVSSASRVGFSYSFDRGRVWSSYKYLDTDLLVRLDTNCN